MAATGVAGSRRGSSRRGKPQPAPVLGRLRRLGHKLVIDLLVHVHAGARGAALPVVEEQSKVGVRHGLGQRSVEVSAVGVGSSRQGQQQQGRQTQG